MDDPRAGNPGADLIGGPLGSGAGAGPYLGGPAGKYWPRSIGSEKRCS
jgi:hypothetical protein